LGGLERADIDDPIGAWSVGQFEPTPSTTSTAASGKPDA
jgi:hypothetical protein